MRNFAAVVRVALVTAILVIGHQVLMVGVDASISSRVDSELGGMRVADAQHHQAAQSVDHGSDEAHTQCEPGHEFVLRLLSGYDDDLVRTYTIPHLPRVVSTQERPVAPLAIEWKWLSIDAQSILQVFLN